MPTRSNFTTVDEYMAALPAGAQSTVQRLRDLVHKAVPGAEEAISYQIPTFRLRGELLIYLAGYKDHVSLYPALESVRKALGDELAPHLTGKSTLRFNLADRVPVRLIQRIVKLSAQDALTRAEARTAKAAARKRPAARTMTEAQGPAKAKR